MPAINNAVPGWNELWNVSRCIHNDGSPFITAGSSQDSGVLMDGTSAVAQIVPIDTAVRSFALSAITFLALEPE